MVLDKNVLNLSLVLPNVRHISIYDCYEAMVSFIQSMLSDVTDAIEAYEIVGSYCPGDYDLSIGGKKFAGISQRRIKDAAAIQIYLDIAGNSQARAALVRDFYSVAIHGEPTKFTYPDIVPEKMASLSELLGKQMTVADMKNRAQQTLRKLSSEIVTPPFSEKEMRVFETRLAQMKKRNERIAVALGR
ncbi:hypothetical protein P5G51_003065 [Virgibacillus sp. 179-BFC.A HS]|uniref:BPL/LPL catalytic domain-containing protein n=1 Tax=Tigheibacillus jepli TaxID=3035914 RepID=A0ABU5CDV9_9BACI|nr:hypothetical protein [Virgibacillus sp. 179-BFC.A HS]MDY0404522.1 hypothetical protein [Virgibacillus sp. 179-BFC.A HS]